MESDFPDFMRPNNDESQNGPVDTPQPFVFNDEPNNDRPPKKPSKIVVMFFSAVVGAILFSILPFGAELNRASDSPSTFEFSVFLGAVMGVIFSPAIIHLANHDASVRQHALRTGMKTPLVSQAVVFSISLCVSCIGFTLIFGKSPGILEGCLIVPLSLVLAPKVQNLIQKIVKR